MRAIPGLTTAAVILAGCVIGPGSADVTGPIVSSSGVIIEIEQSRPVSRAERRHAVKVADEIWAHACSSGSTKPCNATAYYRISMTLELERDVYCLGTMRGRMADHGGPVLQADGSVREASPWVENVEFRCLTNGRAFIESWY
jgi:hypothetical protein